MSTKPEPLRLNFGYINQGNVERCRQEDHREYLRLTGLTNFVNKVPWGTREYSHSDMTQLVSNFHDETSTTSVRGHAIRLTPRNIQKWFSLDRCGVGSDVPHVEMQTHHYKPKFINAQNAANQSFSLAMYKNEELKQRMRFLAEALHIKGPRAEVALHQIRQVEDPPKQMKWAECLCKRLKHCLKSARRGGPKTHRSHMGSHLQVILTHIPASTIESLERADEELLPPSIECEQMGRTRDVETLGVHNRVPSEQIGDDSEKTRQKDPEPGMGETKGAELQPEFGNLPIAHCRREASSPIIAVHQDIHAQAGDGSMEFDAPDGAPDITPPRLHGTAQSMGNAGDNISGGRCIEVLRQLRDEIVAQKDGQKEVDLHLLCQRCDGLLQLCRSSSIGVGGHESEFGRDQRRITQFWQTQTQRPMEATKDATATGPHDLREKRVIDDPMQKHEKNCAGGMEGKRREGPFRAKPTVQAGRKQGTLAGTRRRRNQKWTDQEVAALIEGIDRCGPGHWRKILSLYKVSFNQCREATDLKDKWANLKTKWKK